MNYVLVIKANGTKVRYPATPDTVIPAEPGDEIILVDVNGKPVEASLTPYEEDLLVGFEDGTKVRIEDFYGEGNDQDPVTIGIKPSEEEGFQEYEFNSQIGNLPGDGNFTLMRFSSTDFIGFDVPSSALGDYGAYSVPSGLGFGSDGPPAATPLPDSTGVEQPIAAPDSVLTGENTPVTVNLLANDSGPSGASITLFAIQGIEVSSGDTITLSSGAVVTVNSDGTVLYTPGDAFDSLGSGEATTDSFDYTIVDADGQLADSTATVTLGGENDAPVAVDDFAQGLEDVPIFNIPILSNDSDPDGDVITLVGTPVATNGSVTVNPDGTLTYIPNPDFNGNDTVVYTIEDPSGETATATLNVTVGAVNDAPVAVDDSGSGDEDMDITGNVITNDTDVDGDTPLTVVSNTTPAHGTLVILPNGDYTYTPDANYNGVDSFTYTMQDPSGATDTATVTLTVNPANDPPVAIDDTINVAEDATASVAATSGVIQTNDTDLDGDSLMVSAIRTGTEGGAGTAGTVGIDLTGTLGTLNLNLDGSYDYTADQAAADALAVGESAVDTFTYTISDGAGGTDTAQIDVVVTGTNDGPMAVNDTGAVNEDATLVVNAANGVIQDNDTDLDVSDTLEVTAIRTGVESGTGTGALVGNALTGTYGTLTLNTDGSYSYAADQAAANALPVGQMVTDTFTYTISDGNGGFDTAELEITVTGTNDAPLPNPPGGTPGVDFGVYDDTDTVAEDAPAPITGDVLANDLDPDGDTLTVSSIDGSAVTAMTPAMVVGTYGTITQNVDGTYSYALDNTNPAIQALAVGETTTESFTYTANDGNGGTADADLVITITGTNDVPIANPPGGTPGVNFGVYDDANAISEDAFPNSATGNVLSNDLDPDGDTLTVSEVNGMSANTGAPVTGTYGNITINSDGTYNYQLDNSNPTVQALGVGQSTSETFTYTANDSNGGTATATLTITINGTNDAPIANPPGGTPGVDFGVYDDIDTVAEDAPAPITGDVLANDLDPDGDTLTVSAVNGVAGNVDNALVGTYGTITLDSDGTYSYALDNTDPVIQALAVGETTTETFSYTADDSNGGTADATLTITITGTNDIPIANPPGGTPGVDFGVYNDTNSVIEDLPVPATGNVLSNDLDPDGDTLTVSAVNGMAGNVDSALAGTYGTITLNSDGTYSYALDNTNPTVQALGVGQSTTETFTYTADDSNGGTATATLTITINGTNDAPVAVDDTGSGNEDVNITGNVITNDTDVDGDTPLTVVSNTTPAHGTLVILPNGDYTYTPDANYNGVDSFTYTMQDPSGATDTATVTLTVNPVNDPPVAVDDAGSVDEDAALVVNATNGLIQNNDTDLDGDTLNVTAIRTGTEAGVGTAGTVGTDLAGTLGTLNVLADGSFDYTADQAAADTLAVGETAADTFTYTISDGAGGTDTAEVVFTVTGTNDGPVAVNDVGAVNEDATLVVNAANGVIQDNDTDLDGSDTLVVTEIRTGIVGGTGTGALVGNALTGTYGTLTLNDDGSYSYAADQAAANALPVGQVVTDTFTYTISDGNGGFGTAELEITVTGTNDAPLPNPPGGTPGVDPGVYDDTDTVAEDAPAPITGDVLANDLDPDGDTLTVSSIDGSGVTAMTPAMVVGMYGTITQNADGTYSYALDNTNLTVQALAVGETTTESFTYTANDGNGGTADADLVITITGTNDVPIANPPMGTPGVDFGVYDDANAISEDAFPNSATGNVLSNDLDPDGDTLTVSEVNGMSANTGAPVTGTYGTITLNSDGSYNYQLDNTNPTVQALGVGQNTLETFTYTANDGNGGTATATLTITINGTNDVPIANPPGGTPGVDFGVFDDTDTVAEDAPAPITGDVLTNDLDPDGDTLTVSSIDGSAVTAMTPAMVVGTYGTITQNVDGTYSYALDNTNPAIQALAVGETTTESFTYTANDGNGGTADADLVITITGTNDVPIANPPGGTPGVDFGVYDDVNSIAEDLPVPVTGNVITNDLDPDGDTLTVSAVDGVAGNVDSALVGTYGTITLNSDGSYSYALDNTNLTVQALGVGQSTTEAFTYTANDGNGGTATATLTITITGTNDGPVAVDDTGSGAEDNDITGNVIGNDTDVDGDTPLTVISNTTPAHGTLVIAANGAYTYTPDDNYNGVDSFTYTMQDPSGATDTATVTLTVNPANDPPVAVDDAGSVDEDAALVVNATNGLIQNNDTDLDGDTLNVTAIRTGTESGVGTAGTVGTDLTGTLGTLNVLADGSFDYTADQAAADTLAVGESAVDTFTYTISDGAGGTDTAEVIFTVTGTNDGPVAVNDIGAVNEDATLVVNAANGVIQDNDTDLDASDTLEVTEIRTGAEGGTGTGALVGNALTGTYGTLTLDADGSYSYAADQAAANALPVGQMVTDTFTYTISDGNGGTDTAELVITVTGTNDAPLPNPPGGTPGVDPGVYDDTDTVAEDAPAPITGDVLANDLDPDGDTLTVSSIDGSAVTAMTPAMVVGMYGTITQNADGTYSYALDNTNSAIQALAVGETTTETFTYTANDGNGGTADADLVITITGTNDVPIANPPMGTPGVDFGVYDDANAISEDAFPNSATGNVLSNDLDPDGDTLTVSEVNGMSANTGAPVTGTYGTITLNSDGSYNYQLDNTNPTVQALGVGQNTTETFTYTANDGNGGTATATLTITINGTNDAPIANPPGGTPGVDFGVYDDTDTVAEDAPAPITGDVLANDLDPDGDTLTVSSIDGSAVTAMTPAMVVGMYGTITQNVDGTYSYALDNTNSAIQALAVGETTTESFTYTANDGNGGTADADLVITITGTNDVPIANPPGGTPGVDFGVYDDVNSIAEDLPVPVTGNVITNDLDPDGDTLTVSAVDGVAGNVDNALVGTYGTITLNSDGSYSYALDNTNSTVQALGVGQSTTEAFTYTANDGNVGAATATLTITITGTNDGPVAVDDTGSGAEDNDITGNVIGNDTDVDGDTPLTVISNTTPAHGTLTIAANGAFTYTPDANYNGVDSFTYTMQDPSGATDTATVTLTVNPVNDPPVAVDDVGSVDEDAALVVNATNGLIQSNDTDLDGDTLNVTVIRTGTEAGVGTAGTVGADLTGTLGTLNVLADGSFDYTADQAAADTLAVGETAVDTFTYTISDGAGGTDTAEVVFTVTGTNDGPVAVNDVGAVNEDATLVVNAANGVIQDNDTDLDASDTLEVTEIRTGTVGGTGTGALVGNALTGTYGTLTLNDDGSYSYAADQAAANALPVGQMVTDTFTYTISDGNGGTAAAELEITVTGTNDAPLPNPPGGTPGVDPGVYDDTDTVAEDAPAPITGDVLANDLDPDGDTLTVSSIDGSAVTAMTPAMVVGMYGTITQNVDGTYSYALDNTNSAIQALAVGETTTESFTYTANDGNGGTADADLVITITGTNDVPIANPPGGTPGVDFGVYDDVNSIAEDLPVPVTGNVITNDLDPDGDTLTVSAVDGVAGNVDSALVGTYGTITLNSDGSYSYALDNTNSTVQALGVGQSTTEAFTYTANDGNGGTATASLVINITGTNDAPVAVVDSGSGNEDTDITGNVITNDTDIDGDTPLTVLSNTDPANGTVTVAANGAYTYTPDANFNGTDSFTYVVQDPSGATDTATVTLTVNPVNDPPVGVDDVATTDEDATIFNLDVLGNDTDPDGDMLSVQGTPTATSGTVSVNLDGTLNYTPNSNFNGTDTITYIVTDGNGESDTATVTVTVNAVNDAPEAVDDSGSGNEDTAIMGNVITNDTDVDGDTPLTVLSNTDPANGTLVIAANGAYTYTPDANFNGTDSFTYVMQDPSGATDTATVTLTVNPVNDPPVGVDDVATTDEDAPIFNLNVLGNDTDPDGDTLSVQGAPTATNGAVTVNPDGTLNYTPNPNFNGTDTITYLVTDGNGQSDTATVTVTVNAVNDDPVAVDDSGSANEDTNILGNVITNDTDLDGDTPLTVLSNTNPSNGTLVIAASGAYTYTPDANFNGTDSFTYVVQDPSGATDTATVTLTVNPVNDPPVGVDDVTTTDEDATIFSLNVLGNDTDPDGDILSVQGTPTAPNGTVSVNPDGTLNYTPGSNFNGTDTITYIVTDGNGASDTATVTVTVNAVNDDPVAVDDSGSANEDTNILGNVITNDTDLDGDTPLTVLSNTNPSNGTLVIAANGAYTYTPDANFNGTDSFTYVVQDPSGATDTATVTLTINPVNDPPVGVNDVATTDEDATIFSLNVLGNDTDPDGDMLSVQGMPTAGNGTVSVNPDGTLNYTPNPNFNGTDTITYLVTDGNGQSDTATVTVTVNAVNDAPVAADDSGSGNEDTNITGNVITNDTDVDGDTPLTVLSNTNPSNGSVVIAANGAYTYTPDANFNGTDSFTYVMQDPSGATDTATVTLTVNPVNDPPVGVDDVATTDEDSTIFNLNVLGNDTDPDGDMLSVQGTPTATSGTVSVNPDGTLNYTPNPNFNGTDTITYLVTDGNGQSDTATVTVTVNAVNDAPVAVDDSGSGNEDTNITGNVITNDTDVDGDTPLTVLSNTDPANGTLVIAANGAYTYTPDANFNGTDSFTYVMQDPSGATDTATVTLTVNPVNDPPVGVDDVATTNEDSPIFNLDVLGNDTDPDGDMLSVQGTPTATSGTVTVNPDGTLNYTPNPNFNGTDTITYIVTDGNGQSDTATVTVTVNAVNGAPTGVDDSGSGNEDTNITGNVITNDTDVDGDTPLTVLSNTNPSNGSVVIAANGAYTYTPNANFNGTDSFTYVVQDPSGATDTATVTLTVNPVNDPPVGVNDAATTNEDTNIFNFNILGNDTDPDGDMLSVQGTPTALNGSVTVNPNGTINYAPDLNFFGTDTITYVVTDGNGQSDTATVTVTVNSVNDAPIANSDFVVSTTDIEPVTFNVITNDTDVDGTIDPATVDLDTLTAGIQTSVSVAGEGVWTTDGSGNVTFTPITGLNNQPTAINYAVSDNEGASDTATITLKYSAADVWFGNDESGSVDNAEFDQSRVLISGAADQMSFATGDLAFNAALFTWSGTNQQQMEPGLGLTANKTDFVDDSAAYTRNYNNQTDIGAGIVFGTQQITASVAAKVLANDPRAYIPQVMVILTDASSAQILGDGSLLADAQAAKDAGIVLVFVAIQEAQTDPVAVARLEAASSLDSNGDPLVVTANAYADIDSAEIADLLNAIREAAAAGLLPPVVIDLDGDGAEFTTLEDGVQFDTDGDGVKEQVAWVGEDDALLVYDKNDDGDITDTDEISFTGYLEGAETDLEGLRAFDTDDDGLLSTEDAEWDRFHLWQDSNGDGIVDEGELTSLDENGIESIGLVSDGVGYDAADGDVYVHGESVVTYEDGTTGIAADSVFDYTELVDEAGDAPLEVLTDSGEVVNLDESDSEAGHASPSDAPGGEVVVPEGSPTSSIDEQAANDVAMS